MNRVPWPLRPADQQIDSPSFSRAAQRLRSVHRAAAELKRGTPVILQALSPLVVLPAETSGAQGLADFTHMAAGPATLLLAHARAEAVLRVTPAAAPIHALALSSAMLAPRPLRGLADPLFEQWLGDPPQPAPLPAAADAVLTLLKLARLLPAAVVAPLSANAATLAEQLGLLTVNEADVLGASATGAAHLVRVAEAPVPLEDAALARVIAFRAPDLGIEHLAIVIGHPEQAPIAPLVRLHSECFTGDLLGSLRCDCGPQLRGAIRRMSAEGAGVLLYLAQEGRGIGLVNKLRAYALQDRGLDTLDANAALGWGADERDFAVAATMLHELGLQRIRLLTNNPGKVDALVACGIEVVSREGHVIAPNGVNDGYLATKAERFGHLFSGS